MTFRYRRRPFPHAIFECSSRRAGVARPSGHARARRLDLFRSRRAAVAFAIRRLAGQDWIERQKDQIDGLNVIAVFVFAIVAMESVPRNVMAHPLFAAVLLALIILLSCFLIGFSMLVFTRAGARSGMVIGMLATFRGLVQFPIYLFPLALKPLARRLVADR